MARLSLLLGVFAALLSPIVGTATASPASALKRSLSRAMSGAGSHSGAFVADAKSGKALFSRRSGTPRVLASNTKLFTSAAVLGRYGAGSSLATTLVGSGSLQPNGTWKGSLYLRGGGDPSFGSRSFARSAYGSAASTETLADQLRKAGFKAVTGRVFGDESAFDARRGGPSSGYGTSVWVGPISALGFNRGLANSSGSAFQKNPPVFAAAKLTSALEARGIAVAGSARSGRAPSGSVMLAETRSPTVANLLRLQNKPSDNYFAEMLVKGLPMAAASGGSLRRAGAKPPVTPTPDAPDATTARTPKRIGTTKAGARAAARYASSLGVKAKLVDGSGLSRSDRAAPREVVRLLNGLRSQRGFSALYASLPIAGRDGTLAGRMRSGPARGRCRAKTGTLSNVSALSGYCVSRSGRVLTFSFLMNAANIYSARSIQDRMAQALAGYRG